MTAKGTQPKCCGKTNFIWCTEWFDFDIRTLFRMAKCSLNVHEGRAFITGRTSEQETRILTDICAGYEQFRQFFFLFLSLHFNPFACALSMWKIALLTSFCLLAVTFLWSKIANSNPYIFWKSDPHTFQQDQAYQERGSARRYLRTLRINFTAVKKGANSAVKCIHRLRLWACTHVQWSTAEWPRDPEWPRCYKFPPGRRCCIRIRICFIIMSVAEPKVNV